MAGFLEFGKAVMQLRRAKTAVNKAEEQFSIIGADASVIGTLEMISKVLADLNDSVMKKRYEELKEADININDFSSYETACEVCSETTELLIPIVPRLVNMRTKESVEINKDLFTIGRDSARMKNDYSIDNKYIACRHAFIVKREGRWYIGDNYSSNNTFVNGEMIFPGDNQAVPLKNGDIIKFATEEFVFEEYVDVFMRTEESGESI